MATYLLKTEPGDYSYDDLAAEGRTPWDGVRNPAARKHMRSVRAGDEALIYHTGGEKRIVGLAKIVTDAYEDPAEPGLNDEGQPRAPLFELEPVKAAASPLTLADIKQDVRFEDFPLVRQPRLSVMPVPAAIDRALRKLAGL